MSKLFGIGIAILTLGSFAANAAVVAGWNFDAGITSSPFPADSVSPLLTAASLNVSVTSPATATRQDTGGASGGRLFLASNSHSQGLAGALTFTLQASGATFSFSTLTFNYNPSDTKAPTGISWSYSIGAGASIALGSSSLIGGNGFGTWTGNNGSVDISSITLASGQTLTVVGTLVGGTPPSGSNTGDLSFDNIAFNASPVPEPTHIAMGVFGLIFLGAGIGRYCLARFRCA